MPDKYIRLAASGGLAETEAIASSAGSGDAGKIVATDGSGKLAANLMPTGIGADTAQIIASEALAAGDLVNVWSSSGQFRVRKADGSTAGKEAHCFVLTAVAANATATCYYEGSNTAVTGLSPGVAYLSPTTAGGSTATAPTAAGQLVQVVGLAVSATCLNFNYGTPVLRS
ncbi:hypothetical protein EV383_4370 [Pseudonocardia sediminis]|uniref:Uncharacterized protein n=1 Tax=Pseudonocardia sediminis TaxID=1397368 RepID=A0A4Q7UZM1_PSEST|nr:hypothetical protein [Pseudonocardia sediminis]RZT87446.1 hypothetical protein EV383_4370 [Pseudonocardia sediminis]